MQGGPDLAHLLSHGHQTRFTHRQQRYSSFPDTRVHLPKHPRQSQNLHAASKLHRTFVLFLTLPSVVLHPWQLLPCEVPFGLPPVATLAHGPVLEAPGYWAVPPGRSRFSGEVSVPSSLNPPASPFLSPARDRRQRRRRVAMIAGQHTGSGSGMGRTDR